jgi:hypothetical protein
LWDEAHVHALSCAEWPDSSEVEESKRAFVASFDVCYSFLPLNVESLLSKFEGAVLKFVKSGPPKAAPWIIFVKVRRISFHR